MKKQNFITRARVCVFSVIVTQKPVMLLNTHTHTPLFLSEQEVVVYEPLVVWMTLCVRITHVS